jgi:hypothetical protein
MYVGGQALPTNIHFFVKFRISKIHNVLDVKGIFLKLWIFTNFYMVFPVVLLVFDFDEFLEGVINKPSFSFRPEACESKRLLSSFFPQV